MVFFSSRISPAPDALHVGLAAEPPVGADLAGDAGDLVGEGGELVDHGVDGVLQLQDLAGLPAQGTLGAHLAGDPRDLGGEHGQLVHHAVEDLGDVAHQAVRVVRQTGPEVAVPHGRQARQETAQLLIARSRVDGSRAVAGHAHPRSAPRGSSR
ncbi:hypothetical protein [Streptomyces violaceorubidus]|uniref:hypothetical protein n=1 Tax=Streptomyces violaceorubidus TaxID=284042 RepID=UPI001428949A